MRVDNVKGIVIYIGEEGLDILLIESFLVDLARLGFLDETSVKTKALLDAMAFSEEIVCVEEATRICSRIPDDRSATLGNEGLESSRVQKSRRLLSEATAET